MEHVMKRHDFSAVTRIDLEKNPGSKLNADILKRIQAIETKARTAKAQGLNPRVETANDLAKLSGEVYYSNQTTANSLRASVDEAQQRFEKERDRNPNLSLVEMQRAHMMLDAMTDKELSGLASKYSAGDLDLNQSEVNILASKIKGNKAEYEIFRDDMRKSYANQPWLKDREIGAMHEQANTLEGMQEGYICFNCDGVEMFPQIETLIDFDDELSQEMK